MGIFTNWMGECSSCWENPCICGQNKVEFTYILPKNTEHRNPLIGTIICKWNEFLEEPFDEFVVDEVTESGEIKGRYLDERNDCDICVWVGEFIRVGNTIQDAKI